MSSGVVRMLGPGDPAPDFTAAADDGSTISLKALRGSVVVLYFYPKDDTPGCTIEACELRDAWDEIRAEGATVLGVSPDGPGAHQKFREKYQLPFRLLVDKDHALARAYGAWGEKKSYGRTYEGILRSTFVIDGRGVIQHVFRKVQPKGHAAEILAVIRG
jgi:peroxiredoxin Q/BCP